MNEKTSVSDRKKLRAVIAGLAMPGLGQIYNGDLFKGVCFFCLFVMSPLVLLRLTLLLPDSMLLAGTCISALLITAIFTFMAIEALHFAAQNGKGYILKKYNRWYFYLAFGLFGTVFVSSAVMTYTQAHIMGFYRIVTGSMEPAVTKGDFVIFDKTAYKHQSPEKGDIVVFTYPNDRSKLYVKRIHALPGDTVRQDSSRTIVVPNGSFYVLGDNRGHSDDSRHYGPIPLTELLGKARQVYFSFTLDKGICWKRIGLTLP
jgi:signal peptidase I